MIIYQQQIYSKQKQKTKKRLEVNEKLNECKLIGNVILLNSSGKSYENATFYVSFEEDKILTPFCAKAAKGVSFYTDYNTNNIFHIINNDNKEYEYPLSILINIILLYFCAKCLMILYNIQQCM
jgi:hypothetical protein